MNITLSIQAPELSKAIESLAAALQGGNLANVLGGAPTVSSDVANQPAQQSVPVQQMNPVQPHPVQQMDPVHQAQASTPQTQNPVQAANPQVQPAPQGVPTSAPAYSMDQLAVASTQLMDAGKRNELLQLLSTFGVAALTSLPTEQYGAFATKLRELGANI